MPKFDMSKESLPKVSVIVPIYKTPLNYFKECLESLHAQTLLEAEFIIVFDGEDNLLHKFCEDYQKKDMRFKLYVQPHFGVSATRNFGIKQATGEYITFVDADDFIEKDCCLETYNFAKENNSEVVLFDYTPVDNQYKQMHFYPESIPELPNNTIETIQKESIYLTSEKYVAAVSTWCKFIKKDLIDLNHIHFSTNLKKCVDRPVSFSIFYFAKKISYLNKTFYNYNKVATSITWTQDDSNVNITLAYLTEIKKISDKFSKIIGRCAMEAFLSSWTTNYFTSGSSFSMLKTVNTIQRIAKSPNFQHLIEKLDSSQWTYSVKLEAFLIKHRVTFHIWFHAFKRKYLSNH